MNPEVMTMYHCSLLKSFDICWLTAAVFTLPHHVIFTPLMTKHGDEYHSDEQRRKRDPSRQRSWWQNVFHIRHRTQTLLCIRSSNCSASSASQMKHVCTHITDWSVCDIRINAPDHHSSERLHSHIDLCNKQQQ
jgi:hypothetical protein